MVLVAAPPAAAAASVASTSSANGHAAEQQSEAEQREMQTVKRIEEHLTRIYRQDREQSSRTTAARNGQKQPALQLKLLSTHMALDNLALPYSEENQRLLRTLEQGRIPWDVLRRHPDLQAAAEGKYHDGSLVVEVTDLRAPEHEVLGLERRTLTLSATDDDLLQDLAELELNAVLNRGDAAWSPAFKQRLENVLITATAAPLCLHATVAVGRLSNAMQYNRLKYNGAALRSAYVPFSPVPVKAERYTAASHALPPIQHESSADGVPLGAKDPNKKAARRSKGAKGQAAAAAAAAAQAAAFGGAAGQHAAFGGAAGGDPLDELGLGSLAPQPMGGGGGKGGAQPMGGGGGGKLDGLDGGGGAKGGGGGAKGGAKAEPKGPPLPALHDAPKPPTQQIFAQLCALHKHQSVHEQKVQQAMLTQRHRSARTPPPGGVPPPSPGGASQRMQSMVHETTGGQEGGAAATLDELRKTACAPPTASDVYSELVSAGHPVNRTRAGMPVSLRTAAEETHAPDPHSMTGWAAQTVALRHFQQLEVWPPQPDGSVAMCLSRCEYAATSAAPSAPPQPPPGGDAQLGQSRATTASPREDAHVRAVAVDFWVHGAARARALVQQWQQILSPEASARRVGTSGAGWGQAAVVGDAAPQQPSPALQAQAPGVSQSPSFTANSPNVAPPFPIKTEL